MGLLRHETVLGPHGVAIPTDYGYCIESELVGTPLSQADNRGDVRYQLVTEFREIVTGAVRVTTRQIEGVGERSRWDRIIPPVAARGKFKKGAERVARRCQDELAKFAS